MEHTRAALEAVERQAEYADMNQNAPTACLIRQIIADVERGIREDERRLHQCLEEELDLQTAAHVTGIAYSTLARRVQHGDIPHVGSGRPRRVRVADLPCEAGWLPKLLGWEEPLADPAAHTDAGFPESVSEEDLAEHRRERLRRIG